MTPFDNQQAPNDKPPLEKETFVEVGYYGQKVTFFCPKKIPATGVLLPPCLTAWALESRLVCWPH